MHQNNFIFSVNYFCLYYYPYCLSYILIQRIVIRFHIIRILPIKLLRGIQRLIINPVPQHLLYSVTVSIPALIMGMFNLILFVRFVVKST